MTVQAGNQAGNNHSKSLFLIQVITPSPLTVEYYRTYQPLRPAMTMPAHSNPERDLLQAFLETEYMILPGADSIPVRIGNRHPELDNLLGDRPWAIVTACNPGAVASEPEANEQAHQQLLAAIADAGRDFLPACNRDPGHDWPDEPSLLIINAEFDWLIAVADRLGQLALVAGRPGQAAELWLINGDWNVDLPRHVLQVQA